MYFQLVKNISYKGKLSRADLSRMAGVSRAAVTKWFQQGEKTGWVNVETNTLLKLGHSLHIDPARLLTKPPDLAPMTPRFLWDRLYPDMESFVTAVNDRRPEALARLVQILGFREAEEVVGRKAITGFPKYKKYIKPARRKQLETLWPLYTFRT